MLKYVSEKNEIKDKEQVKKIEVSSKIKNIKYMLL